MVELVQGPDDLFGRRIQFDQQRLARSGVAVADHVVAVRKHFQRGDPSQRDAGQVVLMDLPDDFLCRGHFQDAVSVPAGNQSIAVSQSQRAEQAVAKGFRAVAGFLGLVEHRDLVFPDDLARLAVVFASLSVGFVADQIVAVVQLVGPVECRCEDDDARRPAAIALINWPSRSISMSRAGPDSAIMTCPFSSG